MKKSFYDIRNSIFDTGNYFLMSEIIFWYQNYIRNSDFLISKYFLISENRKKISDIRNYCLKFAMIFLNIKKIISWYQKTMRISDIRIAAIRKSSRISNIRKSIFWYQKKRGFSDIREWDAYSSACKHQTKIINFPAQLFDTIRRYYVSLT